MSSGKADKDALREKVSKQLAGISLRTDGSYDAQADWVLDFARRHGEKCVNETLLVAIFSQPDDESQAEADNAPDKRTAFNWGWSAACSQVRAKTPLPEPEA